ncbi:MAG: sigma-70 family RNA polymerase sigma factor [Bacteroidia bacterium]|nr:sigma-70 family RNA polymerase sigma factor [Bacteroidia bacterium]
MNKPLIRLADHELVNGYLAGNDYYFEILLGRYKSKIHTTIYLIVKDRDITEDIFQDVMMKIIRMIRAGKYNDEGKFLPWAARIARNLAIDFFRKNQKAPIQRDSENYDLAANFSRSDISADQKIIMEEHERYVRELIQQLPDKQREVLVMRSYADLSFKEIAEITNVSINTALGRMRYALINLKKLADEAGISQNSTLH